MQTFKLYTFLMVLIILSSCKKELPFPDIKEDPLLVINSLFSPDSLLQVHVSESCHITDTSCEFNFISDAQVQIKDEAENILAILTHQGNGIYSPDNLSLNHQYTYKLEVTHPGKKSITTQNQIPKEFSCNFLGKKETTYEGNVAWTFEVEINDNPEEKNYYILEGFIEILDGEHMTNYEEEQNGYLIPHTAHYTNDINTDNKTLTAGLDLSFILYPLRNVFLPDDNFNGQVYKTKFGIRDIDVYEQHLENSRAHIFVKSVSKEMYEYYKSIEKYRLFQNNIFSEPEIIYSNINEGIGIFAGYTQKEFVIDLPKSEYVMPNNIDIENGDCTGPCTVKFTTDGGSKLNYNWDFGDGSTSNEPNPEHTYTSPGEYYVNLEIAIGPSNSSGYGFTVFIN